MTVNTVTSSLTTNVVTDVQIGNSSSALIGMYGAEPAAQLSTTGNVTGFAAGSGTASKSDSVWTGGLGTTAYTVGDVVRALKELGKLAL